MNQMMRKVVPLLFAVLLLVPLVASAAGKDDITGHHHEEFLRQMVEMKIMKGYGEGEYRPNGDVTRGQFAIMMTRALHLELPDEGIMLSDVDDPEILAAAGAGLITGYADGTFKPNAKISRQHAAVIIQRALDYMNMEDQSSALKFKDTHAIIKDYHSAISNAVYYNIVNGSKKADGVYFRPADNATRGDTAKFISRFLYAVETEDYTPPVEEEKPEFTYDTATIQADGTTKVVKKFKSYSEALAGLKDGQVIQYGTSILKMPSGIVVTKPTVASSLTEIYPSSSNLKTGAFTYVSADTELEYVSSTDEYVEIKVAGKKGFIKHENSILMPWKAVKERSYYSVSGGVLTHSIYLNQGKRYVSYQAGKAPSFLEAGKRYYSWDGINFFNTAGTKVGTGYQYFQYLPARSKTNYTAAEIDAYIVNMLKQLEKDNPKSYPNALEKSKLVGLGSYLKKVEAEKKVNALLILALAQHESAYGLSAIAQEYNNLFGLKIYDDRPVKEHFVSVEENIDELLRSYLNKNYIPPNASFANGAVFGNKAMGFNVKYASDPFWGAKAAGHFYRIDKAMGGKDLAKPYKVGLTTEALNVRVAAGTENKVAYRYTKTGIPVIISGPATPSPWLKIVSDSIDYNELFVHGDYVKEIVQVK